MVVIWWADTHWTTAVTGPDGDRRITAEPHLLSGNRIHYTGGVAVDEFFGAGPHVRSLEWRSRYGLNTRRMEQIPAGYTNLRSEPTLRFGLGSRMVARRALPSLGFFTPSTVRCTLYLTQTARRVQESDGEPVGEPVRTVAREFLLLSSDWSRGPEAVKRFDGWYHALGMAFDDTRYSFGPMIVPIHREFALGITLRGELRIELQGRASLELSPDPLDLPFTVSTQQWDLVPV